MPVTNKQKAIMVFGVAFWFLITIIVIITSWVAADKAAHPTPIPVIPRCGTDSDCTDDDNCTIATCQTSTGRCLYTQKDSDSDNVLCGTDCDDDNATIGAATLWYLDHDGDGYGNFSVMTPHCTQPTGYASNNLDCDDFNAAIYPGVTSCEGEILTQINNQWNFSFCGIALAVYGNFTVDVCITPGTNETTSTLKISAFKKIGGHYTLTSQVDLFVGWYSNITARFAAGEIPYSAAMDRDIVALNVEELFDDVGGNQRSVVIYSISSNGSLAFIQKTRFTLSPGAESIRMNYGSGIDVWNRTIIIGNLDDTQVIVYKESSLNTWVANQTLGNPLPDDYSFGRSVAIYENYLVVGAPSQYLALNPNVSAIILYHRTSSTALFSLLTIYYLNGTQGLGNAVDVDQVSVYASLIFANGIGILAPLTPFVQGGVYVFDLFLNRTQIIPRPINSTLSFGISMSANERTMIVGDNYRSRAFLYERPQIAANESFVLSDVLPWDSESFAGTTVDTDSGSFAFGAPMGGLIGSVFFVPPGNVISHQCIEALLC